MASNDDNRKGNQQHNHDFVLYTHVLAFFANIPNFLGIMADYYFGLCIIAGNYLERIRSSFNHLPQEENQPDPDSHAPTEIDNGSDDGQLTPQNLDGSPHTLPIAGREQLDTSPPVYEEETQPNSDPQTPTAIGDKSEDEQLNTQNQDELPPRPPTTEREQQDTPPVYAEEVPNREYLIGTVITTPPIPTVLSELTNPPTSGSDNSLASSSSNPSTVGVPIDSSTPNSPSSEQSNREGATLLGSAATMEGDPSTGHVEL